MFYPARIMSQLIDKKSFCCSMTCNRKINIATIIAITSIFVASIGSINVYAEDNTSEYKMAGDVSPVLTFTFRDGVETIEFPLFKMGENFVSNSGATFFCRGNCQ